MRIIEIENNPINSFAYKNISPRNEWNKDGSSKIIDRYLPILKGKFNYVNCDIDAIIIASDLQGNIENEDKTALLGEQLAGYLKLLVELEFNISPKKTGVILAGDLFATLENRGGHGDVRQVYLNFRNNFKWVVGVNGNHDKIGENLIDELNFQTEDDIFILHKQSKQIDELTISGISGIIGDTIKPNRVDENDYLTTLKSLLLNEPDFVIIHESPDYPNDKFNGNGKIRQIIEDSPQNLVICGHRFWNEPLRCLMNGSQILNVHERVIILTKC